MVLTKIVPKADMEILKKYVNRNDIVLIDESVLSELPEEQATYLRKNDGHFANYDFGGDADIWIDLVTSTDHMFVNFLFPGEEE